MKAIDAAVKEFVIFQAQKRISTIDLEHKLIHKRVHYVVIMSDDFLVNKVIDIMDFLDAVAHQSEDIFVQDVAEGERFSIIQDDTPLERLSGSHHNLAVVVNKNKFPIGIINNLNILKTMSEEIEQKDMLISSLTEYQQIFECLEEEIFVTDQEGKIILLNPQAEKLCGIKAVDVIGKHVSDLEKDKIFSTSTTLEVISSGKKVNLMQKLKSGKTVFATGVPVYDKNGSLVRVLSTSKDVKEINLLISDLENKYVELERKNQELMTLREELFVQESFVSASKLMNRVKEIIAKIAPTDLTVLIQGESGVGKEVVTKTIHQISQRNKYPFIKINCGLIPENLLESELFGYEGGAFTGANKHGKIGKVEMANQGTLFLDEIGEMPLTLQVKLLEFLQDREIIRVGGTNKIKVDTRVIAATNRDLSQMVKEGKFRQDLYYRLNIIPLDIPSLRERIEEIPSLAKYFLKKFNLKYHVNKDFDPQVIVAFYSYHWPGNIRELEHIVERLVVTSDLDTITLKNMDDIFEVKPTSRGKVICTDLLPLKEAKKDVEEQLVKKAYSIYQSTYKVGEVLQIDQSTVVKILKKYRSKEN